MYNYKFNKLKMDIKLYISWYLYTFSKKLAIIRYEKHFISIILYKKNFATFIPVSIIAHPISRNLKISLF